MNIIYNDINKEQDKIYIPHISFDGYIRKADFIITEHTLHSMFNLKQIHKKGCDHITWCLYENKRHHNIALTLEEKEAIIALYTDMAQGEYYVTHRAARAIGLRLWDSRHRFAKCKSDRAAVAHSARQNLTWGTRKVRTGLC